MQPFTRAEGLAAGITPWQLRGRDFVRLHPIEEIRRRYATHSEWIEQARQFIAPFAIGGENCFDMLRYTSPTPAGQ